MKAKYKVTLPVGLKEISDNIQLIKQKSIEIQDLIMINNNILTNMDNLTTEDVKQQEEV